MKNFLNTMVGSWLKVFIVAVLIEWQLLGADLWALNIDTLKHLANAGWIALLPVIINYLNPNDPRYGQNKN
jgi:hypothetical protein